MVNMSPDAQAVLIGGDFNVHSEAWGSGKFCRGGQFLLEALTDSNLVFLNDGSPTRITRLNETKSAVDITLVSTNLA